MQICVGEGASAQVLDCMMDPARDVIFMLTDGLDTPLHSIFAMRGRFATWLVNKRDKTLAHLIDAVKVLLDAPRSILYMQNSRLQTPLHLAILRCDCAISPDVISVLLDVVDGVTRCEESVNRAIVLQDEDGSTAFHLALHKICTVSSLLVHPDWSAMCMLLLHPTILTKVDCKGNTPLHIAVECEVSQFATNRCLVDPDEDVLRTQNKLGDNPLHLAMQLIRWRIGVVPLELIDNKQLALHQRNERGHTPLICALKRELSNAAQLSHLVDSDEIALVTFDNDMCMPVHCALEHKGGHTLEVIMMLLSNTRTSTILQHKQKAGRTALQQAVAHKADISIVRMLLALSPFPQERSLALLHEDNKKQTALHLALYAKTTLSIAQLLIDPQRDVLRRADKFRRTPLHVALKHDIYLPEALIFTDKEHVLLEGYIHANRDQALHVALRRTPHDRYAECLLYMTALVDANKQVLVQVDRKRWESPLHIALRKTPPCLLVDSCDSIRNLIDEDQRVLTLKNRNGKYPLTIALMHLPRNADMKCLELLRMLIDKDQIILNDVADPHKTLPKAQFESRMNDRDYCIQNWTVVHAIYKLLTPQPRV